MEGKIISFREFREAASRKKFFYCVWSTCCGVWGVVVFELVFYFVVFLLAAAWSVLTFLMMSAFGWAPIVRIIVFYFVLCALSIFCGVDIHRWANDLWVYCFIRRDYPKSLMQHDDESEKK